MLRLWSEATARRTAAELADGATDAASLAKVPRASTETLPMVPAVEPAQLRLRAVGLGVPEDEDSRSDFVFDSLLAPTRRRPHKVCS